MANYETTERAVIAVTTVSKAATFDGGVQAVYLVCDSDCYVDFDRPAVASTSLLLKANLAPTRIVFNGGNVLQVSAVTASTATLYILGIRGQA